MFVCNSSITWRDSIYRQLGQNPNQAQIHPSSFHSATQQKFVFYQQRQPCLAIDKHTIKQACTLLAAVHYRQGRAEVRWRPLGANVLCWRKCLRHCWDFSAPGALCPSCPLGTPLTAGQSGGNSSKHAMDYRQGFMRNCPGLQFDTQIKKHPDRFHVSLLSANTSLKRLSVHNIKVGKQRASWRSIAERIDCFQQNVCFIFPTLKGQ